MEESMSVLKKDIYKNKQAKYPGIKQFLFEMTITLVT